MFIGIEIGGTKLQLVIGDTTAAIVERRKLSVDPAQGGPGIRRQIQEELPRLLQGGGNISGIGVGFGGPVDWRTGKICRSHQIEGWSGFDLAGWLKELSGIPVFVDNDANVAALGEATRGAGKNADPVFYITLGSGVGGGLVNSGRIYHGAIPGEAEIGHVRLDRRGTIVEHRCSGWAIDKRIRALRAKQPDSVLNQLTLGMTGGEARHLPAALAQGDPAARELLAELARDLGFALSHVTHLFHPEVIIVGGGLSGVGEPLRKAIQESLSAYIMEAFAPGPRILLAALGEDAVPTGALVLANLRVEN